MSIKQAWKDATAFAKQAAQFASVVTSGQASEEDFQKRWASCMSCPRLVRDQSAFYCGACG